MVLCHLMYIRVLECDLLDLGKIWGNTLSQCIWLLMCRYYGLLAQLFCMMKREYQAIFVDCFCKQYTLMHQQAAHGSVAVDSPYAFCSSVSAEWCNLFSW